MMFCSVPWLPDPDESTIWLPDDSSMCHSPTVAANAGSAPSTEIATADMRITNAREERVMGGSFLMDAFLRRMRRRRPMLGDPSTPRIGS